jgi:hypothetical protein
MSESRAWTWRHAIIKSDLPPTTRHVLLTISCYMNEMGDGCYPKQTDLMKATGLSERAVREHLEIAIQIGWLKRQEHGFRGQRWRNYEYFAAWPKTQDVEKGAAPDAGPFDEGAAPPSKTCGTSRQKDRHHVPTTSPITTPVTSPPDAQARQEGEAGFYILWSEWPNDHLPDHRETAKKLFSSLSPDDQRKAIAGIEPYRKAMVIRGKPKRMISYLKDRLFSDFHDDPEIDKDGDFIIRPHQPEWSAWMGFIRQRDGEVGVQRAAKHEILCRKTRWPSDLPLAQRVTNLAPSASGMVADSRSAEGRLL